MAGERTMRTNVLQIAKGRRSSFWLSCRPSGVLRSDCLVPRAMHFGGNECVSKTGCINLIGNGQLRDMAFGASHLRNWSYGSRWWIDLWVADRALHTQGVRAIRVCYGESPLAVRFGRDGGLLQILADCTSLSATFVTRARRVSTKQSNTTACWPGVEIGHQVALPIFVEAARAGGKVAIDQSGRLRIG
jgi:hypothetical protein